MGYLESSLMDGEVISYKTKLSWIVILWPLLLTFIFLIAFAEEVPGMVILPGIWLVIAIINYFKSEFGITNKRLVLKTGVIKRKSQEIQVNKIEGISVDQGIIGRLLGYGTVVATGTGGAINRYPSVADPLTFRKRIQEQISAVEARR
ncbi:PH domain-containing protein [Candidatus Methanocrinis natronophilus]|uniref:PH domain-containing protein n=1 Tax=Candidatus Methanocrinis natronophilus TaxID=3033396 RepID=A0ABT5XAE6_9EURY|nr:PH domain-containing protein [Candidatus Methanocrinis natronophilus]MDF0591671.1 PH domain-containing protein [Candidatus Methanocrinis natronophilus]